MRGHRYVRILGQWWWLVAIVFVVTFVSAAVFIGSPPNAYESRATFVIQPTAVQEDDQVKALDALVQSGTVAETYASIARSSLIRHRAEDAIGHKPANASVSAEAVTGTRLIRLAVTAGNPGDARALAAAVRAKTVEYVDQLGDSYRLEDLDAPKRPTHSQPTRRNVTLGLGAVLGLLLGFGLAVAVDNRWTPPHGAETSEGQHAPVLWTPRGKVPAATPGVSFATGRVLRTNVDHSA